MHLSFANQRKNWSGQSAHLLAFWHRPVQRFVTRSIALVLALTFLCPNLIWAFEARTFQDGDPLIQFNQQPVEIPEDMGQVVQAFQGSNRLVVHIQDLHCQYEVQKNIARLIGHLAQHHQVSLVGLEGASQPVNVTKLSTFPMAAVKREVGDYFVREGKMSGAEFYAATGEHPVLLTGVEDAGHYQAGRRCVETFLNHESQGYIWDIRGLFEPLKTRLFTSDYLALDAKAEAYSHGDLPLQEYARFLSVRARHAGMDLAGFPYLARLAQQGWRPNPRQVLDLDALDRELTLLDTRLRAGTYTHPDQAELDHLLRRLEIMERMLSIAVTDQEWALVRANPSQFQVRPFQDFLARQELTAGLSLEPAVFELDAYLKKARNFYLNADERSQDFVRNLLARMDEQKVRMAVLVTGGYHTQRVVNLLRAQQIGFLSVKPALTQSETANAYYTRLQNRQTPLEKLLLQPRRQDAMAEEPLFAQVANPWQVLDEAILPQRIQDNYSVMDPALKLVSLSWLLLARRSGVKNVWARLAYVALALTNPKLVQEYGATDLAALEQDYQKMLEQYQANNPGVTLDLANALLTPDALAVTFNHKTLFAVLGFLGLNRRLNPDAPPLAFEKFELALYDMQKWPSVTARLQQSGTIQGLVVQLAAQWQAWRSTAASSLRRFLAWAPARLGLTAGVAVAALLTVAVLWPDAPVPFQLSDFSGWEITLAVITPLMTVVGILPTEVRLNTTKAELEPITIAGQIEDYKADRIIDELEPWLAEHGFQMNLNETPIQARSSYIYKVLDKNGNHAALKINRPGQRILNDEMKDYLAKMGPDYPRNLILPYIVEELTTQTGNKIEIQISRWVEHSEPFINWWRKKKDTTAGREEIRRIFPNLLIAVSNMIAFLHSKGVVHADIYSNPNLLISGSEVFLIDPYINSNHVIPFSRDLNQMRRLFFDAGILSGAPNLVNNITKEILDLIEKSDLRNPDVFESVKMAIQDAGQKVSAIWKPSILGAVGVPGERGSWDTASNNRLPTDFSQRRNRSFGGIIPRVKEYYVNRGRPSDEVRQARAGRYDRWIAFWLENGLVLAGGGLLSGIPFFWATGDLALSAIAAYVQAWLIFFGLHFIADSAGRLAPPVNIALAAEISLFNLGLLALPVSVPVILASSFLSHFLVNQIVPMASSWFGSESFPVMRVEDQSLPPTLDPVHSMRATWVDMNRLPVGTLIHYGIAGGHWTYTLRVEKKGRASVWLRNDPGRITAPINKIGLIHRDMTRGSTRGILDETQSAVMPYFNQESGRLDGHQRVVGIDPSGFAEVPEHITIQLPQGRRLPKNAARILSHEQLQVREEEKQLSNLSAAMQIIYRERAVPASTREKVQAGILAASHETAKGLLKKTGLDLTLIETALQAAQQQQQAEGFTSEIEEKTFFLNYFKKALASRAGPRNADQSKGMAAGVLPGLQGRIIQDGRVSWVDLFQVLFRENLWLLPALAAGWLTLQVMGLPMGPEQGGVMALIAGVYAVAMTIAHGDRVVVWSKNYRFVEVPRTFKHTLQLFALELGMAGLALGGLVLGAGGLFGLSLGSSLAVGATLGFAAAFVWHAFWNIALVQWVPNLAAGLMISTREDRFENEVMKEDWYFYFSLLVTELNTIIEKENKMEETRFEIGYAIDLLDSAGLIIKKNLPFDYIEPYYPLRKAVALLALEPNGQELHQRLLRILDENYDDFKSDVADDLLMIHDIIPKNWLKKVPEVAGRTTILLSAEFEPVGGGLAYVLKVDSSSAKKLGFKVLVATMRYRYRKNQAGTLTRIQLTDYPLVLRLLSTIHTKFKYRVEQLFGIQDNGVELLLLSELKAEQARFTNILYGYKSVFNSASAEEFTKFFADVMIPALADYIAREKQAAKTEGRDYVPPVIRGNDSQTALACFFLSRLAEDPDSIFYGAFVPFTTHTFDNRGFNAITNMEYLARDTYDLKEQYRSLLVSHHKEKGLKDNGDIKEDNVCLDDTSLGVRSSHAPNTVSRKQRVVLTEKWKVDLESAIVSITNGENIQMALGYFTTLYEKVFNRAANFYKLTWQEIVAVKNRAKEKLLVELFGIARDQLSYKLEALYTSAQADFSQFLNTCTLLDQEKLPAIKADFIKHLQDKYISPITAQPEAQERLAVFFYQFLSTPSEIIANEAQRTAKEFFDSFFEDPNDQQESERLARNLFLKDMGLYVDPQKSFAYYGGRLVEIKISRERAFTNENILSLLAQGKQVVFFARVQETDESRKLEAGLDELLRTISRENLKAVQEGKGIPYPGNLAFVRQYSDEQKQLLLQAGDVLVLDSYNETGTCEYTEINGSTSVKVSSPWRTTLYGYLKDQWKELPKKIRGEGIIGEQGILATHKKPGSGEAGLGKINPENPKNIWTTVEPENEEPRSYFHAISDLLTMADRDLSYFKDSSSQVKDDGTNYLKEKYGYGEDEKPGEFYRHTLESLHLVKILNGLNTQAAYYKYWNTLLAIEKAEKKEILAQVDDFLEKISRQPVDTVKAKLNRWLYLDGKNPDDTQPFQFNIKHVAGLSTPFQGTIKADAAGISGFIKTRYQVEHKRIDALYHHLGDHYQAYLRSLFKDSDDYHSLDQLLKGIFGNKYLSAQRKNALFDFFLTKIYEGLINLEREMNELPTVADKTVAQGQGGFSASAALQAAHVASVVQASSPQASKVPDVSPLEDYFSDSLTYEVKKPKGNRPGTFSIYDTTTQVLVSQGVFKEVNGLLHFRLNMLEFTQQKYFREAIIKLGQIMGEMFGEISKVQYDIKSEDDQNPQWNSVFTALVGAGFKNNGVHQDPDEFLKRKLFDLGANFWALFLWGGFLAAGTFIGMLLDGNWFIQAWLVVTGAGSLTYGARALPGWLGMWFARALQAADLPLLDNDAVKRGVHAVMGREVDFAGLSQINRRFAMTAGDQVSVANWLVTDVAWRAAKSPMQRAWWRILQGVNVLFRSLILPHVLAQERMRLDGKGDAAIYLNPVLPIFYLGRVIRAGVPPQTSQTLAVQPESPREISERESRVLLKAKDYTYNLAWRWLAVWPSWLLKGLGYRLLTAWDPARALARALAETAQAQPELAGQSAVAALLGNPQSDLAQAFYSQARRVKGHAAWVWLAQATITEQPVDQQESEWRYLSQLLRRLPGVRVELVADWTGEWRQELALVWPKALLGSQQERGRLLDALHSLPVKTRDDLRPSRRHLQILRSLATDA